MIPLPSRFHRARRAALAAVLALALWPSRPLTGQEPLTIQVTKGTGAVTAPGGSFGEVEVEVRQGGKPVPGATVTFILPSIGAGAAFSDGSGISILNTDDQGRAVARGMKANQQEGEYALRVNASFQGQVVSASVTMKNGSAPEEPAAPAAPVTEEAAKAAPPVAPKPTPRPVAKKKSNAGVIAGVVGGGGAAALIAILLGGGTKGCPEDPSKCPPNRSLSITAGAPNIGRP
jgi:hypothetical protein